ncbi:hypothetical protein BC829DRAFT_190275 [Chytridium lagenaria]|nr:hypothetical protein BC829DRAFT_190275 [Chytridium lagenaria]
MRPSMLASGLGENVSSTFSPQHAGPSLHISEDFASPYRSTTPNPPLNAFYPSGSAASSSSNLQFFLQQQQHRHRRSHSRASSVGSHHENAAVAQNLVSQIAAGLNSGLASNSNASSAPSSRSASVDSRLSIPASPTSPAGSFYRRRLSVRYSRLRSRSWTSICDTPSYEDLHQAYLEQQNQTASSAPTFFSTPFGSAPETTSFDSEFVSTPTPATTGALAGLSLEAKGGALSRTPTERQVRPVRSESLDTLDSSLSPVSDVAMGDSSEMELENAVVSGSAALPTIPMASSKNFTGSRNASIFSTGASTINGPVTAILTHAITPRSGTPTAILAHHAVPSLLLQDHNTGLAHEAHVSKEVDDERAGISEKTTPVLPLHLHRDLSKVDGNQPRAVPLPPPDSRLSTMSAVQPSPPPISTAPLVPAPSSKETIGRYIVVRHCWRRVLF